MSVSVILTVEYLASLCDGADLSLVSSLALPLDSRQCRAEDLALHCPSLRTLELTSPSYLASLRELGSTFMSLETLSLNDCDLSDLSGVAALRSLRRLSVRGNPAIDELAPLTECGMLECLDATGCAVSDTDQLDWLNECPQLTELTLRATPLSRRLYYRTMAIQRLPRLRTLDGIAITVTERAGAERVTLSVLEEGTLAPTASRHPRSVALIPSNERSLARMITRATTAHTVDVMKIHEDDTATDATPSDTSEGEALVARIFDPSAMLAATVAKCFVDKGVKIDTSALAARSNSGNSSNSSSRPTTAAAGRGPVLAHAIGFDMNLFVRPLTAADAKSASRSSSAAGEARPFTASTSALSAASRPHSRGMTDADTDGSAVLPSLSASLAAAAGLMLALPQCVDGTSDLSSAHREPMRGGFIAAARRKKKLHDAVHAERTHGSDNVTGSESKVSSRASSASTSHSCLHYSYCSTSPSSTEVTPRPLIR